MTTERNEELQQIKDMIEKFYSEVLVENFHCQDVVSNVESLINYNRNLRERDSEANAFLYERDMVVYEKVHEHMEKNKEQMTIEVAISKIAHLSLKEISEYLGELND